MNIKEAPEIKVTNYRGLWSIIDSQFGYALLEHNTYGDETCYLVVKEDSYTINEKGIPQYKDIVCETYDDIETALQDEGINYHN